LRQTSTEIKLPARRTIDMRGRDFGAKFHLTRLQQESGRFVRVCEPIVILRGRKNKRHAVMHRPHDGRGGNGDDDKGLPGFRWRGTIPEAGEAERFPVRLGEPKRRFVGFAPFVEAVGWNKAASRLKGVAKSWLLQKRPGLGVPGR
jgi:hypothetical protein